MEDQGQSQTLTRGTLAPKPLIFNNLEELEKTINDLVEVFSMLRAKLNPILNSKPRVESNKATEVPVSNSIASKIYQDTKKLLLIKKGVSFLMEDLEI
jgi:archaellum component FlaC